jgi:hypothetical protein
LKDLLRSDTVLVSYDQHRHTRVYVAHGPQGLASTYLYGIEFEVVTDHLTLIPLYNNPTRPAPVRVERHRAKLRSFRFTTIHHPGRTIPCDYASRHPPEVRSYTSQEKKTWEWSKKRRTGRYRLAEC